MTNVVNEKDLLKARIESKLGQPLQNIIELDAGDVDVLIEKVNGKKIRYPKPSEEILTGRGSTYITNKRYTNPEKTEREFKKRYAKIKL